MICRIHLLIFLHCGIFGLLSGEVGNTDSIALPFELGERLEYDMKWGYFPVGSATMEVVAQNREDSNGHKVVKFNVRTNSFADTFYKVRTSISSTIDSSFSRTLRYEKSQHEGGTHREIVVEYDYKRGKQSMFCWEKVQKLRQFLALFLILYPLPIFFACTHYYLEEI